MPFAIFPGRFEQLAKIRQFVSEAAVDAGLSENDTHAVEQAVDEACSNIIEHAYGGENRGEIICTCCEVKSGIKITLQDFGAPFHPEDIPDPDLSKGLMEVKTGGLGLYFIRKLMDEVKFEFTSHRGNILTLVKYRGKST
jgi:serine/threonine-protein kinase RsbW